MRREETHWNWSCREHVPSPLSELLRRIDCKLKFESRLKLLKQRVVKLWQLVQKFRLLRRELLRLKPRTQSNSRRLNVATRRPPSECKQALPQIFNALNELQKVQTKPNGEQKQLRKELSKNAIGCRVGWFNWTPH